VSAQADTGREAPKGGDFNRPEQAVTEVTFWGRRPMVGLRRPSCSCADEGCRRRPTPGAKRPKRAISIGRNRRWLKSPFWAAGPWSAFADHSQADEGCRRRPTPGAKRPKRAISIGLNRRWLKSPFWAAGPWSAFADLSAPMRGVGAGRHGARTAQRGRFQSAGTGGDWSHLFGPQAHGRPLLTFLRRWRVSAQADTGREPPKEGDFNRPEQAVTEVTFLGRRPMVGLCWPFCADEGCRCRPTRGANRPKRAISIGLNSFHQVPKALPSAYPLPASLHKPFRDWLIPE